MRSKMAKGKRKRRISKRVVCSNPTCGKVFEKPKVVRFYACPFCLSKIQKNARARNQLTKSTEDIDSQPEFELATLEKLEDIELFKFETSILSESAESPEIISCLEAVEIPEPIILPEESDSKRKENGQCKFYFGYLKRREKGAKIPESCVECPKSVDCMLSNLYKSPAAVTEIKKWYDTVK